MKIKLSLELMLMLIHGLGFGFIFDFSFGFGCSFVFVFNLSKETVFIMSWVFTCLQMECTQSNLANKKFKRTVSCPAMVGDGLCSSLVPPATDGLRIMCSQETQIIPRCS